MISEGIAKGLAFSVEEFRSRLDGLAHVIELAGCDAAVLYANKVLPGHVRYYGGYETRHGIHDASLLYYHPSQGRCVLLTNASWDDHRAQTWLDEIVITRDFGATIAKFLPGDARTVGIAGWSAFPYTVYLGLHEARPDVTLRDISEPVFRSRMVKSAAEVEVLRKCAEITDAGGNAFLECALPGTSEREVLVRVEAAMKLAGSDEVSFTTQVGAGEVTSKICMYPTDRRIQRGELVQLDCGATFRGYRGDLSRVAITGKANGKLRDMMDTTVLIYDSCLELLRPGVAVSEVAECGLRIAASRGFADCLYRSPNHSEGFFGHGMGCAYHEPPELVKTDKTVLEKNMIIVLEPILMLDGVGGVKIEDAICVTDSDPVRFSTIPVRTW